MTTSTKSIKNIGLVTRSTWLPLQDDWCHYNLMCIQTS